MFKNTFNALKRLSTTASLASKLSFPMKKTAETVASTAAQTTKSAPRSARALEKLSPSERLSMRPFGIAAYTMATIPATAFALGVWQIMRRRQKLAMMAKLTENLDKEPIPLPDDLRLLDDMEFMPIKVVGEFRHDQELIVKPRHRHDVFESSTGTSDPYNRVNEIGAHVITPFQLADRDYRILIQRGWVPLERIDPSTRQKGQRPKFVPDNAPLDGEWYYRDVEMMARLRNCAPVYLEASKTTSVRGGPIGGQTLVRLRNEHMSYIVTWFTLAVATSYLWYGRYLKPVLKRVA